MTALGRGLQILGLILLPLGILLQLQGMRVSHMLVIMVAGFCAFYLGRIVEGYGGARP